jgi:hypothetical protein
VPVPVSAMHVPVSAMPVPVPAMPVPVPVINDHTKTPPYGILKKGIKPTYREWHNTTQKLHSSLNIPKPLIKIDRDDGPQQPQFIERSKLLETIKKEYNENKKINSQPSDITIQNENSIPIQTTVENPIYKKRITKTTKYKLGKQGTKVSVLIKNNQTRRRVQHEIGLLKQKNIMEIKNHLREKNLLKSGSYAPNDVLRQIYEQSILAGDVDNKSKDTLIHNFYNDK